MKLKDLTSKERYKIKTHNVKFVPVRLKDKIHQKDKSRQKGNVYVETIKFNIRIGVGSNSFVTSITLRKNIISLWIVMMEKYLEDPYKVIQEFIEKICLKRWRGETAKGFSEFVTKCMIHSILDHEDFVMYKKVYLNL